MVKIGQKRRGRPTAERKLELQVFTRIDKAINYRLEAAAIRLDRAQSWIIRKAIEEWLDRNGHPATSDEKKKGG